MTSLTQLESLTILVSTVMILWCYLLVALAASWLLMECVQLILPLLQPGRLLLLFVYSACNVSAV